MACARTPFEKECEKITFNNEVNPRFIIDNKNYNHKGFFRKNKLVCGCCGKIHNDLFDDIVFSAMFIDDKVLQYDLDPSKYFECRYCNKINIVDIMDRKRKYIQEVWFEKLEVVNDIQISRVFKLEIKYEIEKSMQLNLREVARLFFKNDEKALMSIPLVYSCYGFHLSLSNEMDFRRKGFRSYDQINYIGCNYLYPEPKIKDEYKYLRYDKLRDILQSKNSYFNFGEAVDAYNYNSKIYELIIQNDKYHMVGRYDEYNLIQDFLFDNLRKEIVKYFNQIRIAIKNNYSIDYLKDWIDYLSLLEFFNKDINNPKYICPKNLYEVHNLYVQKKNKILDAERIKEKISRAKNYSKYVKKYIGIDIGSDDIIITILPSVKAFKEEGDAMHHCVFTNEYYKKIVNGVLILSARNRKDNRRLETIEYDLKSNHVVQSRSKFNQNSKFHDEIIKLVESNGRKLLASFTCN